MQEQNLKNHRRLHPLFHYFLAPVTLLLSIVCFLWLISGFNWSKIFFGAAFSLIYLAAFVTRDYAKKNQDRIIRAEIRFRYFLLAGKDFTSIEERLSMQQIVALRFASDQDLLNLTKSPDLSGLSSKQIKQSLKEWKADRARV